MPQRNCLALADTERGHKLPNLTRRTVKVSTKRLGSAQQGGLDCTPSGMPLEMVDPDPEDPSSRIVHRSHSRPVGQGLSGRFISGIDGEIPIP